MSKVSGTPFGVTKKGEVVWELTLAECASLAGITNNPSLYAPQGVVDVVRYQCQNPDCKLYSLTKDEVCEYCGAENSYDSGSVWTNGRRIS